jgi:two-component system response regulator AtoC
LIAKAIHSNSPRKDKPFIRVNCGAIPEGLMESELFGHEKGAFTGAVTMKVGRFEMANGGTLFFDEVGELSPPLQVKLLRVLQEKEFERVGGTETIRADVRIIAATNRIPEEMIHSGKLREDLYYRLNVVPIHVPPLRERAEDIPLLVEHYVKYFAQVTACTEPLITQEARDLLQRYYWPGNVRELANILERAVIMSSGVIDVADLPGIQNVVPVSAVPVEGSEAVTVPLGGSLKEMVRILEREVIVRTLKKHNGNRLHSAAALDISRRALLYKLEEYGLGSHSDADGKE